MVVAEGAEGGDERANLSFRLAVRLRVACRAHVQIDAQKLRQLLVERGGEARVAVADDALGHTMSADDGVDEAAGEGVGSVGGVRSSKVFELAESLDVHLDRVVAALGLRQTSDCILSPL